MSIKNPKTFGVIPLVVAIPENDMEQLAVWFTQQQELGTSLPVSVISLGVMAQTSVGRRGFIEAVRSVDVIGPDDEPRDPETPKEAEDES